MTRKQWTRPELRTYKLSEEELAAVQSADDPIAALIKMKPELARRKGAH